MSILPVTSDEIWLEQRLLAKAMKDHYGPDALIHDALDLCETFYGGDAIDMKKLHNVLDRCRPLPTADNDHAMYININDVGSDLSIRIMLGFVMSRIDKKGRVHPRIVSELQELNDALSAFNECHPRAPMGADARARIKAEGRRTRAYTFARKP